jgi:hypothetical protein
MAERARSGGFLGSMRRWLGARRAVARVPAPADPNPAPSRESDPRVEIMLAEWQDVRESLRSLDAQRFAQFAVFIIVSGVILYGYLPIASGAEPRFRLARWALPALGVVVSLVFLALEAGLLAYRREWVRRGRQIETALQVLVPGLGHVSALALLSEFDPDTSVSVRAATGATGALCALMVLAWAAALLAMAFGALG